MLLRLALRRGLERAIGAVEFQVVAGFGIGEVGVELRHLALPAAAWAWVNAQRQAALRVWLRHLGHMRVFLLADRFPDPAGSLLNIATLSSTLNLEGSLDRTRATIVCCNRRFLRQAARAG
ncbi:hypothetical protein GCM10011504_42030 [Siccirubricoccus deserti]|nr:hypothetical protein GCM10011504_42030 [Siccirubricoccus deserti]